jgi:membrane associated rhomboid family serine protease
MAYYSSGNSFGRNSPVVINLIILNVLVFVAQQLFKSPYIANDLTVKLAMWPMDSGLFKPYQFVTSMFAHKDLGHIAFNMLALYMFGSTLEKVWGAKRFFIFYFACGLAAGLAALLMKTGGLGASGAVMGLFAAFAYLFPNTELFLFIIPIPVKAKYMVVIMAALDLFGVFGPLQSGIAHWAHLGGLAMGFILVLIWNKTNKKTFY